MLSDRTICDGELCQYVGGSVTRRSKAVRRHRQSEARCGKYVGVVKKAILKGKVPLTLSVASSHKFAL